MKYIIEKGLNIPLCAYDGENYINYMSGLVVENDKTLNFIKKGLKDKSLKIIDVNLVVYGVYKENSVDIDIIGYNVCINGSFNFIDYNRNLMNDYEAKLVIDNLGNGKLKQRAIWCTNE